MNKPYPVLITTANNLEGLLLGEATELGLLEGQQTRGAVQGRANRETVYRLLLGSRLASRVLLPITDVPADDADRFYDALRALPWASHLTFPLRLAVHCHGRSSAIRHTRFGAQRVKDAVVDHVRADGQSVSVDRDNPDIQLSVRLRNERAEIALDLSGDSLHRRGYRRAGAEAPLKEPLAAAVLMRADWPERARPDAALFDPCCGAGTLLAEGAMIAAGMAPGLLRDHFGVTGWRGHDETSWQACRDTLAQKVESDPARLPLLIGRDRDPAAVRATEANLDRLGLAIRRDLAVADATNTDLAWPSGPGVMVTNPPYGHRLTSDSRPEHLYRQLGERSRQELAGWRVAVMSDDSDQLAAMGLQSRRVYNLFNGQRACRLGVYDIHQAPAARPAQPERATPAPELRNRLLKNARHLGRWRRRQAISCYRLYQADMPEYPFTIDVYETERGRQIQMHDHGAPARLPARKANARRESARAAAAEALELSPEAVRIVRPASVHPVSGGEGQSAGRDDEVIQEGEARFRVVLNGHPETGLFPDHRLLRQRLHQEAAQRRFLSLDAHTGAATIQAALGGASSTTSVESSPDNAAWIRDNLELNGLAEGPNHQIVIANAGDWLATAARQRDRWDIILLDDPVACGEADGPPRPQQDPLDCLEAATALLAPGGWLYFCVRRPDFEFDTERVAAFQPVEITRDTVPRDYQRASAPHRCWCLRARH